LPIARPDQSGTARDFVGDFGARLWSAGSARHTACLIVRGRVGAFVHQMG
jgi:fructose-1,6-bisphosphatase/inositol monophosphatase family enzyme